MEEICVERRTLGINFNESGIAEIVLWAPLAKEAAIIPEESKKPIPLAQQAHGYWYAATDEIKPGDQYRFSLDGKEPLPDPASLSQPEGVHGSSEAIDLKALPGTDNGWNNIPLEDYILYELHTGAFTEEGTFAGIEEKLHYLKELGVTAIEIMPVAQFPGGRNWGYDGVFPFAVQDAYGGPAALRGLVDACHQKGLAVVLDVVYNHLGPEGNYLGAYGPYFTDKYRTPWGSAVNFDDAWCDGVRRFFVENALMWFRDFRIDALRLDAVHAIKDFSPVHILREIKMRVNELMAHTGRMHYLIVESDLNDTRFINGLEEQGYGMEAQWVDEFHHALRVTAGEPQTGYYSDFNGLAHLAKSYRDAYVYDGQFSPHRQKNFGIPAEENAGRQFIVFSQNHDQVGNRMLGERTSTLLPFELQKLMAGAVLVSPFLPMLFMGEEWSEPNPFLYFVSHTDPELAEAVRKGRKAEFAAFQGEGEAPDPMDEATFLQSKLQWDLLDLAPHQIMNRYYRALIALRKTNPALNDLNRKNIEVTADEERQTLFLNRWHDEAHVYCLMNFSKDRQQGQLPESSIPWTKTFDSAAPEWGGPVAAPDVLSENGSVSLQPHSLLIYTNTHA